MSLEFCNLTKNETARKAMDSYIDCLKMAFKQYRDLWEDYIELQEKYEQYKKSSLSQMPTVEPCIKIKNELKVESQLNSFIEEEEEQRKRRKPIIEEKEERRKEKKEGDHNSLLNSSNMFNSDDMFDIENDLPDDICDLSEVCSSSPLISKTHTKTNNSVAKIFNQLSEAASVCSKSTANTKMFHNEKAPSKNKGKLDISTTYHVETTFLPNGKKLKQSQITFHPVKHGKEIPFQHTIDVNKLKPAGTMQKAKQNLTDTSNIKESIKEDIKDIKKIKDIKEIKGIEEIKGTKEIKDTKDIKEIIIIEDNATGVKETFEDVTEIGPTQIDIHFKSKHCLKLKRKAPEQTIKNFPDKKKHHSLKSYFVPRAATDDIDFDLSSSPTITSAQMTHNKSSVEESKMVDRINGLFVLHALKNKIDINNISFLPHKSSKADIKSTKSIDNQGEDQTAKHNVQNIVQNSNDEEETFYLPAEQTVSENDTYDFTLDDTENKPPVKKTLNKTHVSSTKKECMPEQLNMRRKADKAKLNGWDCWECEEYYKNLSLSKEELQKRKNQCSRHRQKFEKPKTPEGFWDPEFPETLSSTWHNIE